MGFVPGRRFTQTLVTQICVLFAAVSAAQPVTMVTVDSGSLRGTIEDGLWVFRGIPYAEPPVGERRWRPPIKPEPWRGVRDATRNGHACPQALGKYPEWADTAIREAGLHEDCLTLNVWAPAKPDKPLPVMFYMHGGNMQFGSIAMPLYNGNVLARDDVVVVFINYRLGFLGRFGHPALARLQDGEPLVNYGLQDQIAALEWVQRNIAVFGGDPDNVTIFGHSAGGVSVNALMVTPRSKGLFHRAIAQGSGILIDRMMHAFESYPRGLTGMSSMQVGEEVAEHFGVTGATDIELAAALRALPWKDLVDYQESKQRPFNPVVDGMVLTEDIAQVFEQGEQHDVPYMAGANSWEWDQIDNIPLIGKWFMAGAFMEGLSDEDLAVFDDQWTRIGVSQRWFAEGLFLTSTRYLAAQMKNVSSPAYLYHVTYQQTAIRGEVPGAAHGAEMPAVFGNLREHPEYQRPRLAAEHPPSEEDLAWADTVRGYWLNFAKTGNPNGSGLPEWPVYNPESDLTMDLGIEFIPRQHLYKETLDYLEQRALVRRAGFAAADDG
jgi:para-nitrobenzyl esterase